MEENLDKKILRGLYDYQQECPGSPKMGFKELLTQIYIGEDHTKGVHETLSKLEEDNLLNLYVYILIRVFKKELRSCR